MSEQIDILSACNSADNPRRELVGREQFQPEGLCGPTKFEADAEGVSALSGIRKASNVRITFTIVIPAYNREDTIDRCLRSCLAQQYPEFEVVLVDDGSTDRTVALAEAISDARLRVIKLAQNRQVSFARNRGSEAARGDWLVYLDSDDVLLPGYLERMAITIEKIYPEYCIIASPYLRDDGPIGPQPFPEKDVLLFSDYLRWQDQIIGSNDILICRHRQTWEQFPWPETRAREALTWMRLYSHFAICFVREPGGKVYTDACNRHTSDTSPSGLLRWRHDAKDMAESRDMLIDEFGSVLAKHSPRQHRNLLRSTGNLYFMSGHRWLGVKRMFRYLRAYPFSGKGWLNLCFGLVHHRAITWAIARRKSKKPAKSEAIVESTGSSDA